MHTSVLSGAYSADGVGTSVELPPNIVVDGSNYGIQSDRIPSQGDDMWLISH